MGNSETKSRTDSFVKDDSHNILNYYSFKQKIGSGSFAVVKLAARKSDGTKFAIKIIPKKRLSKDELAVILDEVKIMKLIDHKNIVKLYEIFNTPSKLYMVLELLDGGELFDRIVQYAKFSEADARLIILQITDAVEYLHSKGIVHRDLKPENLLYKNEAGKEVLKITDFGLAKYLDPTSSSKGNLLMQTACGTPGYVAPEVIEDKPYDYRIDLWSIGVILYILLCGFPPFYDENTTVLYAQIKSGKYSFPSPYWDGISSSAKDLVKSLLTVNPNNRLGTKGLLTHSWMVGSVPSLHLGSEYTYRLSKRQLRRRLRKGINMIMAVNRITRGFEEESKGM